MKVKVLHDTTQPNGSRSYFFECAGQYFCALLFETADGGRTHLHPAEVDERGELSRAMGGVQVFSDRLTPQVAFEVVAYADGQRREGAMRGIEQAQREMREALGL